MRQGDNLRYKKIPRLRDFSFEDSDGVINLWVECGLVRSWNDPLKDIARKVTDRNGAFWIAEDVDGVVIASVMIGYDGHRGSINYLAVAEPWQGGGLGGHIMARAEGYLVDLGCPKIGFCVRKENTAVLAFYDRLGYATDDVHVLGKRLIPDD